MSRFIPGLCLLLLSGTVVHGADKYTQEILNKTLKALGESKEAPKEAAITTDAEATVTNGDFKITLNGNWSLQEIGKIRFEGTLSPPRGQQQGLLLVVNKTKAWVRNQQQNRVDEAPKEVVPIIQSVFRAIRLAQHPYLLRDKKYQVESLGELKVGKRDTIGLKVKEKGQKEVDLYVDKKTHLPFKCSIYIKEPTSSDEVEYAFLLDNYKKSGNRQHFTKFTVERDGTKLMEMKLSNIQLQEKLNDSVFAKP